ncbi:MAG: GPR endopeptidase [Clostridia bacterium]|nr:GPR endopeptidase [Clostridia bacterium]
MQYRTDLAMERAQDSGGIQGVRMRNAQPGPFARCEIEIRSPEAAERLQKPMGQYITLETPPIHSLSAADRQALTQEIAESLKPLLPTHGDVLVVGLGNRHITSDALGSRVCENVLVTRHLKDTLPPSLQGRLRGVSALAPGVLGITGMETADMVRGAVDQTSPAAVIAVDALSARECGRIGTAIQITDTGIQPGSGVGNHRMGLTRDTLHVPVIAVGVPTVVYSTVIVRDALALLLRSMPEAQGDHAAAADALTRRLAKQQVGEMVVTPREIDQMVGELSQILSMGLNQALQPRLTVQEIGTLMNEAL